MDGWTYERMGLHLRHPVIRITEYSCVLFSFLSQHRLSFVRRRSTVRQKSLKMSDFDLNFKHSCNVCYNSIIKIIECFWTSQRLQRSMNVVSFLSGSSVVYVCESVDLVKTLLLWNDLNQSLKYQQDPLKTASFSVNPWGVINDPSPPPHKVSLDVKVCGGRTSRIMTLWSIFMNVWLQQLLSIKNSFTSRLSSSTPPRRRSSEGTAETDELLPPERLKKLFTVGADVGEKKVQFSEDGIKYKHIF